MLCCVCEDFGTILDIFLYFLIIIQDFFMKFCTDILAVILTVTQKMAYGMLLILGIFLYVLKKLKYSHNICTEILCITHIMTKQKKIRIFWVSLHLFILGFLVYFGTCSSKGAYIKYVGRGGGGFYKFFKKIFLSPGDHRPKYFLAQ